MTKKIIDIPDFLIEMSEQINTQDNRITADPIWLVCYDKKYPCGNIELATGAELIHESEVIFVFDSNVPQEDELIEIVNNLHEDNYISDEKKDDVLEWISDDYFDDIDGFCDFFEYMYVGYYYTEMYPVKYCLTEKDAKWFINRKQHDYPKLYTFVDSMVFCPQMIELRNWISSLTKEDIAND